MYITILISAAGIFVLFRILSFLNKKLPYSKDVKHYTGYIMPVVEMAAWLGFVIWCIRIVYEAKAVTTLIVFGILVLILIFPAWFFLRDFLFGMLLKIQRKIETGDRIEIEGIKGVVIKTDSITFDIKTGEGNIDTIPYSRIKSKVISKNGINIHLEKHPISFRITSDKDINKLIPQLKITLINAPWAAASQEPVISGVRPENGFYDVDVFVYLTKKEHVQKVKEYVTKNFIEVL